jgi:hypothetical protein
MFAICIAITPFCTAHRSPRCLSSESPPNAGVRPTAPDIDLPDNDLPGRRFATQLICPATSSV